MPPRARARQNEGQNGGGLIALLVAFFVFRGQAPPQEPPPGDPGAAEIGAGIVSIEAAQRSRFHARQSNKRVGDSGTIRVSFRYRGPDERLRFDFELTGNGSESIGGRNINVPASTDFVTRTISHSFTFPDVPAMPAQLWDVRVRVELDGDLLDQETLRDAYWIFVEL